MGGGLRTGTKGVPRAAREDQILAVAAQMFGTAGYAATSVAEVAEASGISKPLVYQYFGSKDGLYAACLDLAGRELGDEIERIARGDSVGLERGLRTLEGMFTVLDSRRWLWRLSFDPTAPGTGPAAEVAEAHAARIGAIAHEGVAEMLALAGVEEALDVSAMTSTWLGIVDSLVTWWVDHPDQTAAAMTERVQRLIGALLADLGRAG